MPSGEGGNHSICVYSQGRAFNLSPFVVLLALAFWSTLWGLPGALLAVPLTVSLVLVLAELKTTHPIAVLLSANGKV